MKLYQIEQQFRDLVAQLENPEIDETIYKELDALSAERDQKLDAICTLIKEARIEAAAVKGELDSLRARIKSAENLEERLKHYLGLCLTPGEKFANSRHKIGWRASEAVEIADESQVPQEYWVFAAPTISKSKVKDALKSGAPVPGAKIEKRNNIQVG